MDKHEVAEYTLEQFQVELKALLLKAANAGLDVDDIGTLTEETLAGDWE